MDFRTAGLRGLRPALQVQVLRYRSKIYAKKTNAPGIDGVSTIPGAPRAREAVQFVVAPELCA